MIKYRHGSMRGRLNSSSSGASMPNWEEAIEQKIMASDAQNEDNFGIAVAISGDGKTAIAGASWEGSGGRQAGAAYIFTYDNGSWSEQVKLTAGDPQIEAYFGWNVDISSDGQYAIVSAQLEDVGGSNAGAAYVFSRSGETWSQQEKLVASDAAADDNFGYSVAISGDGSVALIGARYEDTTEFNAGSVYAFTRSESTWNETQKIQASDPGAGDDFGQAVSISDDGNTAIISNSTDSAYIFTRDEVNVWSENVKIQSSDVQSFDSFGWSVAMSGDGMTAIASAHNEDTGGNDSGAAYIFTRDELDNWTEQQKIVASDPNVSDSFSHSVAISSDGNTVILGAYGDDEGEWNSGAAYIFSRSNGTWSETQKIISSDIEEGDSFGYSVAIDGGGTVAMVGAYLESTGGWRAGAAYIYQA